MKSYLFSILFAATYALSRSSNNARSTVDFRQPLGTENDFFSIIIGNETTEENCKSKLKAYCGSVKSNRYAMAALPQPIQQLCSNASTTACSKNLNDAKEICRQLEGNLTDPILPTTYNCSTVLPRCLIVEGFCGTNDTGPCHKLLSNCYDKALTGVYDYPLLRIFAPDLWSQSFESMFRSKCLNLLKDSGEGFIRACLNWTRTRDRLRSYHKEKCIELDAKIGHLLKIFSTIDSSLGNCPKLLEECYYLGKNCSGFFPRCNHLREVCGENGYTFTPSVTGAKESLTLLQGFDIDQWFNEVYKYQGITTGSKHKINSWETVYWILFHWPPNPSLSKCNSLRDPQSCNYISYFSSELSSFCTTGSFSSKGPSVCPELPKLDDPLRQKDLFRQTLTGKGVPPNYVVWLNLSITNFDREYCHKHLQHCIFLIRPGNDPLLGTVCSNFMRACYRTGRHNSQDLILVDMLINYLLQMHQPFGQDICLVWLADQCNKRFPSPEKMEACTYPDATCKRLGGLIEQRCSKLWGTLVVTRSHNQTSCDGFTAECNKLSNLCDPFYLSECPKLQEKCSKLRN